MGRVSNAPCFCGALLLSAIAPVVLPCRPDTLQNVQHVHLHPSPALRQRLGFAAVALDMGVSAYGRKLIETWRSAGEPKLSPVADEVGSHRNMRIPCGDETRMALKLAAARADVSQSTLLIRIFSAYAPMPIETLAEAMGAESRALG